MEDLVIKVHWTPDTQDVNVEFDNAEFHNWEFVSGVLAMAVKKADTMVRLLQMDNMQRQAQKRMEEERVRVLIAQKGGIQ